MPRDDPRLLRHIHKLHRNLRRNFDRGSLRLLGQRIFALLAIGQAHGRAEFVLRDVLEARQVLASVRAVAGLLIGARQSELRRGVQRIQLERMVECVNRLRKLLELRIHCTEEVPGVGITVVELDDVLKIFDRSLGIAAVLVEHAERVPDVRIFGIAFGCVIKNFLRFIHMRKRQLGDALVDFRCAEIRIGCGGILKILQAFFKQLLIHVGGAEIVQACGVGRVRFVFRRGGDQDQRSRKQSSRAKQQVRFHC